MLKWLLLAVTLLFYIWTLYSVAIQDAVVFAITFALAFLTVYLFLEPKS